jgi:hypothetical protein
MRRIGESVTEILQGSEFLSFGFHHDLFNLTRLAEFIHPMVEARTRKTVQTSAILMNLSRIRKRQKPPHQASEPFKIDHINIHANLCSITILKTRESHRILNEMFGRIQGEGGFITITEGVGEITTIVEMSQLPMAEKLLGRRQRRIQRGLAGLGIKFSEKYLARPGILYLILQRVVFQNINVSEVASTAFSPVCFSRYWS